ncbi:MAG: hypothetical protein HQM03_15375 [Magnetococcales bacterium]|nr:hypothetical protein [Magnetococcales bacterium]
MTLTLLPTPGSAGYETTCRKTPDCLLTIMARLPNAPFPYAGMAGESDQPFFDHQDPVSGQRFHTTGAGNPFPEYPHYRDDRVLIHLPPTFRPRKPFAILVFFHGHHTEINRTLVEEMALLRQVNASGRNLVLVAPQMALDAADSSPGKLWRPLGFARLLDDVTGVLRAKMGKKFAARLHKAPVILAAYSGGYRAAAFTLDRGLDRKRRGRLQGVILLDALYGDLDKFDRWLRRPGRKFLVNLYGVSTTPLSLEFQQKLRARGQPWSDAPRRATKSKNIHFLGVETPHEQICQEGPPHWPLSEILKQMGIPK